MSARKSRITVSLNISSKLKRFQGAGVQAAYDVAWDMAERGRDYARENVEPGVGPASHDFDNDAWGHEWPHADTKVLWESVEFRVEPKGFIGEAQVYTDEEVGTWLEIGWHSRYTGNFFRYPWLKPAMEKLIKESASDLPDKIYRALTEQYSKSRGRIDEPNIRQWIRKEELEHFSYTEE